MKRKENDIKETKKKKNRRLFNGRKPVNDDVLMSDSLDRSVASRIVLPEMSAASMMNSIFVLQDAVDWMAHRLRLAVNGGSKKNTRAEPNRARRQPDTKHCNTRGQLAVPSTRSVMRLSPPATAIKIRVPPNPPRRNTNIIALEEALEWMGRVSHADTKKRQSSSTRFKRRRNLDRVVRPPRYYPDSEGQDDDNDKVYPGI